MFLGGGESNSTEVVEEVKPEKGDPTYVEFKPFTVNLGPDDPVGFLQVQINVLTYFSEVAEELETHKPLAVIHSRNRNPSSPSSSRKKTIQKEKLKLPISHIPQVPINIQ